MTDTFTARTPWQVTRSVWYALFMREAMARTTGDRMAWFWMLAEPVAMIIIMILIRTVIMGGSRHVAGAEIMPWMIVGMFGFFLFRDNMMRSMGAVDANKALFAYRQVKPVDPVFVRCYVEGLLQSFIFLLFIGAGALLAIGLVPDRPLQALFWWGSLWCLGLSAALALSALASLVPEVGRIARMISMPLLVISGVIFPLNFLPHELQQYLLWNPILHGLELLRGGFFERYQMLSGTDPFFLWYWTLGLTSLGLMLHLKFEQRLKAQ